MAGFLFGFIGSTVKLNFYNPGSQSTARWYWEYCVSTIQTPGETNCNTEITLIGINMATGD